MAIVFRRGTLADVALFTQFLEEIKMEMSHKEWFYLDPPEVVREMMTDGTMKLWLAMDGEQLAAVFDILYPGLNSYNYGYDLDLNTEELLQVVHMDTAAVHPDYRGRGLQTQMVQLAEEELSGKETRILLSTVHPDNRFSLNNMLCQGYMIQKRVEKYGSERYILRKNIFEK